MLCWARKEWIRVAEVDPEKVPKYYGPPGCLHRTPPGSAGAWLRQQDLLSLCNRLLNWMPGVHRYLLTVKKQCTCSCMKLKAHLVQENGLPRGRASQKACCCCRHGPANNVGSVQRALWTRERGGLESSKCAKGAASGESYCQLATSLSTAYTSVAFSFCSFDTKHGAKAY